jgi:Tfp pilus assembly protein PilV
LTLVETMLAMVVLSVAVFGLLSTLVAGEQQLQEADHALAASRLARDLLEEIVARPYEDPQEPGKTLGPEQGETNRTLFDDCDDYDKFHENPGEACNAAGTLYQPNQQAFKRRVSVTQATNTIASLGATVPGLLVEVTVEDSGGRTWNYTRFIPQPH